MFVVKWAANSVINSVYDTTTRGITLIVDNTRFHSNEIYSAVKEFTQRKDQSATEKKYHQEVDPILERHNLRKELQLSKHKKITVKEEREYEALSKLIQIKIKETEQTLNQLKKSYLAPLQKSTIVIMTAELTALKEVLQAHNHAELNILAKYHLKKLWEFNQSHMDTSWSASKKNSSVIELLNAIVCMREEEKNDFKI